MPNNRRYIKQPIQVIPGRALEWQAGAGETTNDRRAYAIMRELEGTKVEFNSTGGFEPMTGGSGGTTTFPNWINGDLGVGAPPPTDCRLYVQDTVTFAGKSAAITAITQAASAVVTVGVSHTFVIGDAVEFSGVLGMVEINGLTALVTAIGATTITVNINSTAFTAYTSGGVVANPTGQLQKLCFTVTPTANSGLRGLHLQKASGNLEPLGVTLEYDTGPVWDTMALDFSTTDLVLAYSHALKADNFRFRQDTAQLALGRVVGQPAASGGQLQVQAGVGATITGLTDSTTAVITVASTLGFRVGDTVTISGITAPAGLAAGINGTTATVTALTTTTLTTTFNTDPFGPWSAGGSVYVQTDGLTFTGWGNATSALLLQGLPNTVTRRTKLQFGLAGPQVGSDAGQVGTNDWFLAHGGVFPMYVSSAGLTHIGGGASVPVPTAKLHLGAGAAAASGAPLKLTSGTNLTTPEAGAIEYNGTELFFTRSSTRLKVLLDTPVDGTNITLGTTTGTKIGTGTTEKLGFWNATPVVRPSAYTQTFATADKTIAAYTSDPESSAYTGIDNAQPGTVYATVADLNLLRAAYENLRTMAEDVQQGLNAVIDDLQTVGMVG